MTTMALRTASRSIRRAFGSQSVSTFSLPELPYEYAALEPHFDEKTMTVR